MMNETNIDHLMQLTLRRADWHTANVSGGRDDRPAFDDHLAQASTPRTSSEPPPPRDSRPAESNPPGGKLPSQGDATRSEVEENKDAAAAPSTADDGARDDEQTPDNVNGDTPAVEKVQDDASSQG